MALFLRSREVEGLLDLRRAMQVLEGVYADQAEGKVKASPPLRLMGRGIRLVAGGLEGPDRIGVRLSPTGGAALAVVYEMSSGDLLSIMGYPFSSLRISALYPLAPSPTLRASGSVRESAVTLSRLRTEALIPVHRA